MSSRKSSIATLLRRPAGHTWRRLRWFGLARYCVLCRSHLRTFLPHGNPIRAQSVCPVCQSRERHRLAWLYLERHLHGSVRPCRLLHLAPEPSIAARLRTHPGVEYVSGDLRATEGIRLDVRALPFASASFDLVYCSHVLNMVDDDVAALSEIGRVMHANGMLLIQVPVSPNARTLSIPDRRDTTRRMKAFGDPDIAHLHGQDVVERFGQGGLGVERVDLAAKFSPSDFERLGLIREDLVLCRPISPAAHSP